MQIEATTPTPTQDRRVRRSRRALMQAAVALVAERGTVAVSISDLAEAADLSRPVLYQQFGDRDTLVLEAALDLARRELLPRIAQTPPGWPGRERALVLAQHFAEHRRFYRAIFTGSPAFALNRALTDLLMPFNRETVQQMSGPTHDPRTVEDLATFLTGGGAAFFNTWVVQAPDPLDAEEFTDRLMRMATVIIASVGRLTVPPPGETTPDEEPRP